MKRFLLFFVCFCITFVLIVCDDNDDELLCTGKSCELARCECLEKSLDRLEDNYRPYKKWIKQYENIVEEYCDCIKRCEKKAISTERANCIAKANEQLVCNWRPLNKDIIMKNNKSTADDILKIFQSTRVQCVNREYKSCCEGDSCSPFFQNSTRECVEELFNNLEQSINKKEIKGCLQQGKTLYLNTLDKYSECRTMQDSHERATCYQTEFNSAIEKCESFKDTLSTKIGICTAASVISTIEQGLVTCNWDWISKQQQSL